MNSSEKNIEITSNLNEPMYMNYRNYSLLSLLLPILVFAINIPLLSGQNGSNEPIVPPKPNLSAVVGDGSVTLYWDDIAESHYDPFFENYVVYQEQVASNVFVDVFANPNNFQGYKIYKSTDPEFKNALRITDNRGNPADYIFEVIYDLQNNISGYHPASINGQRKFMGTESGISRVWHDTGLMNGRTYYYAVVSFTHGDALPGLELPFELDEDDNPVSPIPNTVYTIPPLESGFDIEVLDDGTVITGVNVVKVTPRKPSTGYIEPSSPSLTQVKGTGTGNIFIEVIDPWELKDGNQYSVTFEDTLVERTSGPPDLITKNFSLVNTTTGDTLFSKVEDFLDVEFPVKEGFLFGISDVAERVAPDMENSGWISNQSSNVHELVVSVSRNNPRASDYEIEVFDGPVRESTPFQRGSTNLPAEQVNFVVTNAITGEELDFAFLVNPQLPRDIRDVAYLSEDNAVVAGAAGLIQRSSDGGENWDIVESNQSVRFHSLSFTDEQNGWAAGRQGVVIRTNDGGLTWSDALDTGVNTILNDIFFIDTETGWAVGESGVVIHTSDGGNSWQNQNSGTIRSLNGVFFVNENVGYASGLLTMIKTTDGGATWGGLDTGVGSNYQGLHFTDEDTGWIVGTSGRIMQTTDGGVTWQQNTSNTGSTLNAIHFINDTSGWAVGQNGTIVQTSDAGVTWTPQTSGTNSQLYGLNALSEDEVIVVGANSMRIRSFDGGVNWALTQEFRRFRAALDDNNQSRSDIIYILEEDENQELIDTWQISMLARTATSPVGLTVDPIGGDLLQFFTIKPFTENDEFQFTITGENKPAYDQNLAKDRLADIKVVPNPYLVSHVAETGNSRQLHFTNLPADCTIRIFSVSGRLIQTLDVNNSIDNDRYIWDMRTNTNSELPFGVYIYKVSAPGVGEKVGKFAVIK